MTGIVRKLVVALALLAVAYAGFRWGPAFFPPLERALGIEREAMAQPEAPGPTPEVAEQTLDRFERFRAGEGGSRLALGSRELSSVVRYALPGILPPGVHDPTVLIEEGRVHLSARVAVDAFPELPRLDQIVGLLPDTVSIDIRGTLVPFDRAVLALMVDRVQAAKIPIPGRLVADVLEGLGRRAPSTMPPHAIPVPFPDGIQSVFVQQDSLVLLAHGAAADSLAGG